MQSQMCLWNLHLVVGGFLFVILTADANSVHAQYLADRLVPPRQVPIPELPRTTQPEEPRIFGAEKMKSHLWSLPFGSFPGVAVALSIDQRAVNWKRPVLDVPSLGSEAEPARPSITVMPVSPRSYVSSPNPWQPPVLARFPLLNEPLVRADEDPGASSAFEQLTRPVALATPGSIAMARIGISDPFEQIRIIRLSSALADDDEPAVARERPSLPKLPMVEVK